MSQALLLIDIQNDYFSGGPMELVGMTEAANNASDVLDSFRSRNAPLFHVQHFSVRPDASFFLPNTSGVEHHTSVTPKDGEVVIQKNYPNALRDTNLEQKLHDQGIEQLVIVGAMSHMCIDATTRAAFDAGFQCTVIEDACATRDLNFKNKTIAASDVHSSFMAALSAPYAAVVSTADFLSS